MGLKFLGEDQTLESGFLEGPGQIFSAHFVYAVLWAMDRNMYVDLHKYMDACVMHDLT